QSEGLSRAVSFFKVDDSALTHDAPRLGGSNRPAVAKAMASQAKSAGKAGSRHGGKPAKAPGKSSGSTTHAQRGGHDEDDWEEF
ncbi:MAG: hypothetical protein ACP5DC_10995, partial [Halothiobacillaceae bacterium]